MLENDIENKTTNVDYLLENDAENKIANVEGLLKGELATVTSLKLTEDSKSYLMNTLEKLSSNFSSDDIVEDAHMLPQFF